MMMEEMSSSLSFRCFERGGSSGRLKVLLLTRQESTREYFLQTLKQEQQRELHQSSAHQGSASLLTRRFKRLFSRLKSRKVTHQTTTTPDNPTKEDGSARRLMRRSSSLSLTRSLSRSIKNKEKKSPNKTKPTGDDADDTATIASQEESSCGFSVASEREEQPQITHESSCERQLPVISQAHRIVIPDVAFDLYVHNKNYGAEATDELPHMDVVLVVEDALLSEQPRLDPKEEWQDVLPKVTNQATPLLLVLLLPERGNATIVLQQEEALETASDHTSSTTRTEDDFTDDDDDVDGELAQERRTLAIARTMQRHRVKRVLKRYQRWMDNQRAAAASAVQAQGNSNHNSLLSATSDTLMLSNSARTAGSGRIHDDLVFQVNVEKTNKKKKDSALAPFRLRDPDVQSFMNFLFSGLRSIALTQNLYRSGFIGSNEFRL